MVPRPPFSLVWKWESRARDANFADLQFVYHTTHISRAPLEIYAYLLVLEMEPSAMHALGKQLCAEPDLGPFDILSAASIMALSRASFTP